MKKINLIITLCIISLGLMSQEAEKSIVYIKKETPKVDLHLPSTPKVDKGDITFAVLITAFNVATSISYFNMDPDDRKYMMLPYIGTSAISAGAIIIYLKKEK